jgi:hypothetical protein
LITNAVFQSDAALFSRLCPITKKPSTTAGAVRTLAPVQRGRLGRLGITDEVRRCPSPRKHMRELARWTPAATVATGAYRVDLY